MATGEIGGMNGAENRLDASLLTEQERALLPQLLELARREQPTRLGGGDGPALPLPKALGRFLGQLIEELQQGRTMILMPADETYTTQRGADFLGVSRQHFVDLLESGQIAFHRVGTHRRVAARDLLAYAGRRDVERRNRLGQLFGQLTAAGLYDADDHDENGA